MVVIRKFVINHMRDNRAQLGVDLRLNNIPVPAIYGPSSDECQMYLGSSHSDHPVHDSQEARCLWKVKSENAPDGNFRQCRVGVTVHLKQRERVVNTIGASGLRKLDALLSRDAWIIGAVNQDERRLKLRDIT